MNQILSVEDNNKNNKNSKGYGKGNKIDIKAIVIFFCIILILFGIFIIANGAYSIYEKSVEKSGQEKIAEVENPEIQVEMMTDSKIKIIISHTKEIKIVEYNWNGEDTKQIKGDGKTNIEIEEIEIPAGTNTLNIKVTDVNGEVSTRSKEYTSPERPTIKLSQEENAIKVEIESSLVIDYVTYYWDDQEPKTYNINATKTSSTLEVKEEGEHILNISAVDKEGNKATKKIKVTGAIPPEVQVSTDKENFIVKASDQGKITKVIINMNGEEKEEEVSDKEYQNIIKLKDGENRIIVTVYNEKGIKKVARVKYTKE